MAGDTLRETNMNAVNAELAAMGQQAITSFNHEAVRLPNGDTAVIASNTSIINVNGTPTTYNGNAVLVLNQNFQVAWVWNAFDWLNTNRLPTDGEGPSDWLHANSISWSPEDGDLIVSLRAQDWVLKLDYDNGSGDGHIVWTLGQGGNFTIESSDPSPWFSHQHDVQYIDDSTIVLFDDGNTRRATNPNADSRGQELILNEQTMTATLVVNADLGNYSPALGSAQLLPNGNLAFTSGDQGASPNLFGQTIEVLPNGTQTFVQQTTGLEYRSFLMSNLYGLAANVLDPGFEDTLLPTGESGYQYEPTGTAWSFSGTSGVAGNDSAFTSGNPSAPQGTQVAFLQNTGSIRQVLDFPEAGAYQISLSAAQRENNGPSDEEVEVEVDGTVVDIFTPAGTGYATATTASFNVTAGSHTITLVGVDPTGAAYTALLDQINVENAAPTSFSGSGSVDLSTVFNRIGIVTDGTKFSGGGLDGDGYALSANLVGTSLTAGGATFNIGPVGASNVVSAAGQTIALPSGNDTTLHLLATGVNGNQVNQGFTVTYTDGSTATFTQSISDWAFPQGYSGESTALATSYRDTSGGTEQSGAVHVYDYMFTLNPAKTVSSIKLPNDGNVEVLALTLVPVAPTQVNLSSVFNRTGIVTDGTTFGAGGLDGDGYALSSNLVGTSVSASGAIFDIGPAGANDVVSAAGQTIALPSGNDGTLVLLATGVNGNQVNQTFTVIYSDGTTATFTQSISDWAFPGGYSGESTALSTSYRDTSGGTEQSGAFRVYDYTFTLNPTKTVVSVSLPKDSNVEVLAVTLVPAVPTQVNLSSAFNRTGIVTDGSKFSGGGLDGEGNALSSNLVGTSVTANGATFNIGPAGANDVVSAAGQTIALPSGNDSALELLATGVNGGQTKQTFTVNYTDGTKATFTQSISDWAYPQGNVGESTALTTSYRDTSIGTEQSGTFHLYYYAFALDPTKTVSSITLPTDGNVEIVAIDVRS